MTRVWPVAYWLLFAALLSRFARSPGFVMHRELVPYPWKTVGGELLLLALLTAWLVRLVRWPARRGVRWSAELIILAAGLLLLASSFLVKDLPGDNYGVAWFAVVSLIVLIASSIVALLRRRAAV